MQDTIMRALRKAGMTQTEADEHVGAHPWRVGRSGWLRAYVAGAMTGLAGRRAEAQRAAEDAAMRRRRAAKKKRDEGLKAHGRANPTTAPVRVWFAKGACFATVPVGTAYIVGDSESSELVAVGTDDQVLAAWRVEQDGPTAWAGEKSPEWGERYRAEWGWIGPRLPGHVSGVDRVFGRCS